MTSSPAVERVLAALQARGLRPVPIGQGWKSYCPGHEGHSRALNVSAGDDGRALLCCHGGCDFDSIRCALGLEPADLAPYTGRVVSMQKVSRPKLAAVPRAEQPYRPPATLDEDVARWQEGLGWPDSDRLRFLRERRGLSDETILAAQLGHDGERYTIPVRDAAGKILFVKRYLPGAEKPTPKFLTSPKGAPAQLYGLDTLRDLPGGALVVVAEGELDALLLHERGITAVSGTAGASTWRDVWSEALTRFDVVVIGDHDAEGEAMNAEVMASITAAGGNASAMPWPEGTPPKTDPTDFMVRDGHTVEEFRDMVEAARPAKRRPLVMSLWSDDVQPEQPAFAVPGLIREEGLHLVWAAPSGLKTMTLLTAAHELLAADPPLRLLGHPDLTIASPWRRVLWIATEETAGGLRYRAERVVTGFGSSYRMGGEFMYAFAAGSPRLTLDNLADLYAKHGPFDAAILDSLTGLRPKTVNGERVRWDLDNDAANEQCLMLRALAVENRTALFLVHHTGRDTAKGYRGPTDWWASADVMFGLTPADDRVRVAVEKNRDGRRPDPFHLRPSWDGGAFTLVYDGEAPVVASSPAEERVLSFYVGRGKATQAEAITGTGLSRSTVQLAVSRLRDVGRLRDTGLRVNQSPVLEVAEV